jgi:excisionase family DNA binding protein
LKDHWLVIVRNLVNWLDPLDIHQSGIIIVVVVSILRLGYNAMSILEMDPFDEYQDVHFAAKRLRIHPESVKRLIRLGKLPARKFANKWFVRKDELEQFARSYIPRPGKRKRLL